MSHDAAEGLYRLVDAAYEKRSVAISSNLHPAGFDELDVYKRQAWCRGAR